METDEGQQTETNGLAEREENGEQRLGSRGEQLVRVAPEDNYFGAEASADPSNRDPVTGDFLPGHKIAGPGRPKGSLNFMSVCRTKSKEAGVSLSDLVWAATRGLAVRAARGDAAAAKVLLDRLCGPVDKALVEIDARSVGLAAGPPIPAGGEFSDWVRKLNAVAAQQGLLGDSTPTEVVEAALAEVIEVEALLA